MAKKKQYSAAYRANAVRLATESERPIAGVARDLGVSYQTLYGWMERAGKTRQLHDAPARKPGEPPETPEEEVRRLRRELDEVRMERDFLKKAAAFFARMNK